LVIFPALIQLVQTVLLLIEPLMLIFIFCRLGKKRRRVFPTIFEPAPPFRLTIPRLLYLIPGMEPFPQISHIVGIFGLQETNGFYSWKLEYTGELYFVKNIYPRSPQKAREEEFSKEERSPQK